MPVRVRAAVACRQRRPHCSVTEVQSRCVDRVCASFTLVVRCESAIIMRVSILVVLTDVHKKYAQMRAALTEHTRHETQAAGDLHTRDAYVRSGTKRCAGAEHAFM